MRSAQLNHRATGRVNRREGEESGCERIAWRDTRGCIDDAHAARDLERIAAGENDVTALEVDHLPAERKRLRRR